MSVAPLGLALVFMATLFTLLLADYARYEQEIGRLEARAARLADRLVSCELENVNDPRGQCAAALSELARDGTAAACLDGSELTVTLNGDWSPELWVGLNPLRATVGRRFEGWDSLKVARLISACSF